MNGQVPRLGLLLCLCLAMAGPARPQVREGAPAGGAPGAAAAPEADSTRAASAAGQSPAAGVVGTGFASPSWVMVRSMVFPGWGQLKNGAYLKALIFAGIEGALLERLYFEDRVSGEFERKAQDALPESAERERYEWKAEKHARHRRDFIWWTGIFIVLSAGDAYVDAQLKRFDVQVQTEEEAALPGGRGAPFAVRLGVRLWR